jgi:hypothetical protein
MGGSAIRSGEPRKRRGRGDTFATMAADPAPRRATYQDVLDAPPHTVAEVIEGVLYTHPRPAVPHPGSDGAG